MSNFYVEVPIRVRPGLPKGQIHKLVMTADYFEIKTWANIYGNKQSETLLTISYQNIIEVDFKMPRSHGIEGKFKLTFYDEAANGRLDRKTVRIRALLPNGQFNNELTQRVAFILQERSQQRPILLEAPYILPLQPPSSPRKFFAGLALLTGLATVRGLSAGVNGVLFFSVFFFFPSVMAVGIDYIRLNTGWPLVLKLLAYLVIFLLGFFLMIYTILALEARGVL